MKKRSYEIFRSAIKSPQTLQNYTYSLDEFMKFCKISDYDVLAQTENSKIERLLEDWVMDLSSKHLKSYTIRGKLAGVTLFLDMNRIVFNKKIIRKMIPSDDYIGGGGKPYTTEEISLMLKATIKPRTRALIHFLASTGVRPSSLTDPVLRLKHVEDMPLGCKSVKIYDGSKEGYWSFLTPEASKALDDYLMTRKTRGEKLDPESPLFATTNKIPGKAKNSYMSAKSVRQIINGVLRASGISRTKDGNRFDKAPTYGFRKRFNTTLKINNEVNSNVAEKMMGHKRGLDGTYLVPTREECFNEFVKAIGSLTISDEFRNKQKIQQLEQEKSEIENLKDQMEIMQQGMNKLANHRQTLFNFYKTRNPEKLKELDLDVLEKWGCWDAIVAGDFDIGQLEDPNNHPRMKKLYEP